LRPHSRGSVTLTSSAAREPPLIEFNFLAEEADLARMAGAFSRTVEVLEFCRQHIACGAAFPVRFGNRLRRLNELTRANRVKTAMIAGAFDLAPALADFVLTTAAGERIALREVVADPARLAEHLRRHVAGVFHPVGTCRMGAADDPLAVVDPEGRVHGVGGLRVADASIMPNVVAGNTNLPTIMLAEKIAAAMGASPAP
jgi:5-(hydroxymethyl)furfural/furfural oxidase